MHSTSSETRRRWAVLCLSAALFGGCGESPEERRATLRAEAEREFGRPATGESGREAAATPSPEASAAGEADGRAETGQGGRAPGGREGASPARVASSGSVDPEGGSAETRGPSAAPPTPDPRLADPDAPSAGVSETTPPTGQEPTAESVLADADAAYSGLSSLRAAFVQRVDLPLVDRSAQGHGIWLQEGRDRFLMDFTEPADDVFVADGEFLWLYQPSATPGQVIKSALEGGGQAAGGADVLGRILSEARASYDAVYEGSAIVSGVRTHVIALTPRGPSDYRLVRVWIADADRLVRRFRIEEENETIRTVTLAELEPNVPIDPSVFVFVVPDGVQTFER